MGSNDIMIYLSTNVFAGSDTTAISLRSIFYYLCRNPEWMKRVVEQILGADSEAKLDEIISYKPSTTDLPIVQAVIKEGFRMHPPTGNPQERIVPEEGLTVDGYFLPGGSIVGMNPWLVSRDPEIFVQPEKYRPERWLEASPEEFRRMETLMEFNFSYGARKRIGRNIAMIELTKLVPQILRLFEVDLANPEKEWELEGYTLVFQKNLFCRLKPRNGD